MEQELQTSKKRSYGKAVAFFVIEILAILAFNLGNSFIFFSIAAIVIGGLCFAFVAMELNSDGISSFAFFLFPLVIYGILSALSYFNQDDAFNLQNGLVVFIPIALAFISFAGYCTSINKEFPIKWAIFAIYTAMALAVAINLIATLVEFTPMHTILYRGKYIFYDGKPSRLPVSEMGFALMGFKLTEVSIRYFSMMPTVLLSSFIPLFFMNYRENKKFFLAYLCYGILGFLALALTPTKWTILTDGLCVVIIALIILAIKFHWNKKFKYTLIGIGAVALIGFIIVFINAQSGDNALKSFIANNSFLNKVLNRNRFFDPYNGILNGLIGTYKTFGTPTYATIDNAKGVPLSGSWFFDNFVTSGLFGGLFFIFALVVGIRRMIIYYRKDSDPLPEKTLIIGFVFTFFGYSLLNFEAQPFVFSSELSPIFESGLFLIAIFFLAYTFFKGEKPAFKKVNKTDENSEEENDTMEDNRNEEISL